MHLGEAAVSKALQTHSDFFCLKICKDGVKDNPSVLQEVEQITHTLTLDDATNGYAHYKEKIHFSRH